MHLGRGEEGRRERREESERGLRDPHGSLNRFWRVLTTPLDIQRVLNHRRCDKRHMHGSLCDHYKAISAQFPRSLCETLAKQFFAKDR